MKLQLCFAALSLVLSMASIDGRILKGKKTERSKKNGKREGTTGCNRMTWSIVNPNKSWGDHPFNPQVWYHTLEDIYGLWKKDYFDYVLDIRPLEAFTIDNEGQELLLEGYQDFHIPYSYPINLFPPNTPADEVELLIDFAASNICKDSRVFVHCWSGISGNRAAQTLVDMGFTNVHAAGPQGTAGIWDWKKAGYPLVFDDTFNKDEDRFHPRCLDMCEDE